MPLYVVAATYEIARTFARVNGVADGEIRRVREAYNLRGLPVGEIWLISPVSNDFRMDLYAWADHVGAVVKFADPLQKVTLNA